MAKKANNLPVPLVTHPIKVRAAPVDEWTEELDRAINARFPSIKAYTTATAKGHTTYVAMKDGGKPQSMFRRSLMQFVAGFMASEESYDV